MRRAAVTTLLAGALLAPASASASTVVGSSLSQRADLHVRCDATCTEVQRARPGSEGYVTPVAGVITQWRVRAATQGAVRLKVLREVQGKLRVVAASDEVRLDRPRQPGKDVLYTFPTRLSVRAGDRLALDRDRSAGGVFHSYGQNASYATATYAPALAEGEAPEEPTSTAIGRELLINADVEDDDDGDGLGDETQEEKPGTGTGAGTATDVGTGTTTTTTGTEGPPVQGERSANRTQRGHGGRPAPRPAPEVPEDRSASHGARVGARKGPAKAPRTEHASHGSRKAARKAPRKAPRTRNGVHRTKPKRAAPRKAPTTQTDRHGGKPKRTAPRRAPVTRDEAHGSRPKRKAPARAPKEPGFRPHDED